MSGQAAGRDQGSGARHPRAAIVPGFTLQELLGQGGMGSVYRALDPAGRPVALKLLSCVDMTLGRVARFEREAELLARLRDPSVVTVHAWGSTGVMCWLACELVEGRHADVAARQLDLAGRVALIERLARAVGAAHAAGIVHRDLKPQNLLVDARGAVKVIDFGVATAGDVDRLTRTGQFLGTPQYAPPERLFGGQDPDAATGDVWSLGALAYELLGGAPPYPAENPSDLYLRATTPPRPLRELEPAVPDVVAAAVQRALSPLAADRQRDAMALADELAGRARPPPRARRAGWVPLGVASLAGLVGVGGVWAIPDQAADEAAVAPRAASEGGLLDEAQALAAAGRWSELQARLAAGPEPLAGELRPLRGLAALFQGQLAAARADLPADEPLLALEAAREELLALDVACVSADEMPGHCQTAGRLTTRTREGTRLDDPGGREVRRRVQDAVAALVVRGGTRVGTAEAEALLAGAARLLEDPRPALAVARVWNEFCVAGVWSDGERFDQVQWVASRAASLPPLGDWVDVLPADLGAVALGLHLVAQARAPDPARSPRAELVARLETPLEAALGSLGLPGATLHALATCQQARLEEALVWEVRQAGDEGQALELGVRALQRFDAPPLAGRFQPLETSLALLAGDAARARSAAKREKGHLLRAECDLVAGDLRRVARALEKPTPRGLEAYRDRLRLHLRVLAGELTAAEALAQLGSLAPSPEQVAAERESVPVWHTVEGLRTVLQGGWWPGSTQGR